MVSTSIVQFAQTAVSVEDLDKILSQSIQTRPQQSQYGTTYLRLSADGEGFHYGQDNIPVEEGSRHVINPFTLRTGWVCWADPKLNGGKREKLDEKLSPSHEDLPEPELSQDFADRGGKWQTEVAMNFHCVSGEDEGLDLAYHTASGGGGKYFDAILRAINDRPDRAFMFPVVELRHSSYKNQNYGGRLVYVPEVHIVDWADNDRKFLSATEVTVGIAVNENVASGTNEGETTNAPEAEVKQQRKQRKRVA